MRRSGWIALGLLAGLGGVTAPARGGIEGWSGHLSIGYAKLFISGDRVTASCTDAPGALDAPSGSLSVTGGVDYPVTRGLRAGVDLGYHLLGSHTIECGSLLANLDYSVFEAALSIHWIPDHWGPLGRISAGPALLSARADLSTAGGGAAFGPFAVEEAAPGVAAKATLIPRSLALVRVGLELGATVGFLPRETWTIGSARVAIHY